MKLKLKKYSRILAGLLLIVGIISCQYIPVNAAQNIDIDTDAEMILMITETDEATGTATGYIYPKAAREYVDGHIAGDGVRLRSAPSLSASVLELMYAPEMVKVNLNETKSNSEGTWLYVQRVETTQTWGYVAEQYVYFYC